MIITPAFAQAAAATEPNALISFMPFVLIFVIMYFLIIRPQQKKVKEHQQMVATLEKGNEVITTGGIYGKITRVIDENEIEVQIADGVNVRMVRQMVSELRNKAATTAPAAKVAEKAPAKPASKPATKAKK